MKLIAAGRMALTSRLADFRSVAMQSRPISPDATPQPLSGGPSSLIIFSFVVTAFKVLSAEALGLCPPLTFPSCSAVRSRQKFAQTRADFTFPSITRPGNGPILMGLCLRCYCFVAIDWQRAIPLPAHFIGQKSIKS